MSAKVKGVMRCKWCNAVTPRRRGKVYCSSACKQRDYRDRRKAQNIGAERLLARRAELQSQGYATTFVDMQLQLLGRGF